jgi:hypothetical protein
MIDKLSTTAQAIQLSKEILDDIEINNLPISQILFKTTRLARILHDTDAQLWLYFLQNGYPIEFDSKQLGKYAKYYSFTFTFSDVNNQQYSCSLPFIENFKDEFSFTSFINADKEGNEFLAAANLSRNITHYYHLEKSALHNYVTGVFISLSIGDIAGDIFQEARVTVDNFINETCSKDTAEKLLAINDRLKENNQEAYSQALLSCRRILESVADSIFPAQNTPYTSLDGKQRDVGPNNYINRILAYIEQNSTKKTNSSLIIANLEHLAARLDALNNESQKGVHDNVTIEESRLTIIQMYLIIAEVARTKQSIPKT